MASNADVFAKWQNIPKRIYTNIFTYRSITWRRSKPISLGKRKNHPFAISYCVDLKYVFESIGKNIHKKDTCMYVFFKPFSTNNNNTEHNLGSF